MYKVCNGEDEFEPRVTPKPAMKLDCISVPIVPEVSLIFDKPFKENVQNRNAPVSILKSVERQNKRENINASTHPHNNESYAAWREQNQYWKSPNTNTDRALSYVQQTTHNKVQSSPIRTTNRGADYNASRQYVSKELVNDTTNYKSKERYIQISNNTHNVGHSKQQRENNQTHESERGHSQMEPIVAGHKKPLNGKVLKMPIEVESNQSNIVQKNEYPTPHVAYHYPYLDAHGYPFSPFYPPAMNTNNIDNQETVKNLLQLVNNQSEQIKSLQQQLDRLLKMQEECFKERQRCNCQGLQQSEQVLNESYDKIAPSTTLCNRQPTTNSPSRQVLPKDQANNIAYDNAKDYNKQSDAMPTEFQTKKAFVEQKVSIGVMTSFEFTVQNNPFTLESENYQNPEISNDNDSIKRCNAMNLCDKNEALRKYKTSFSRVPSGQLENIVEDSESYLSSSQQQSSNINSSTSTRDIERPMYNDIQKGTQYSVSDYPRPIEPGSRVTRNDMRTRNNLENNYDAKANAQTRNSATQDVMPASDAEQNLVAKRNTPNTANWPTELNRQAYDFAKGVKDTPIVHRREQQRPFPTNILTNNPAEDSLIFNSCDLRVNDRPPSPEPSIHVEMNEYSSDDESEKVKRTSKVGWTFYNNVLGQVNQILHNTSVADENDHNRMKGDCIDGQEGPANLAPPHDTVKVATFEQLRKLGISLSENIESGEANSSRMVYDSTFYPRLDHQASVTQATSAVNETNTSMHMKALAMKYLSDDQLAELAIQRQGSSSLKQLMLSNMQGTNMSFATMRYLERYQLLPGKTNEVYEVNVKPTNDTPAKADPNYANQKQNATLRFPFNQTPRTTCPSKILDISTLKQQPKLL